MDTTLLNTTIPPEVSEAIGRIRMGANSDADTQILMQFMMDNKDTLRPDQVRALTAIVDLASTPRGPSGIPTSIHVVPSPAPAPANLPTPSPPQISGPPSVADVRASAGLDIPSSPNDPSLLGPSGVQPALSQPGMASITAPPPPSADAARGGIPLGVAASQRLPRDVRAGYRGNGAGRAPGEDWRGINAMSGESAFSGIDPQYLQMFANDPTMAAAQIARQKGGGQDLPMYAAGIAPTMSSLMNLSSMGMLGGSKGKGLGLVGPQKALSKAESTLSNLGPGEYIDPATVLRMTSHRLGNTGNEMLGSNVNDQIDATNAALLNPQEGLVSQEQYNALARMLQDASNDYLMGLANGKIDQEMTYPRWLREQRHAQKFFGR